MLYFILVVLLLTGEMSFTVHGMLKCLCIMLDLMVLLLNVYFDKEKNEVNESEILNALRNESRTGERTLTNRYLDGIVLNKYDFESIDRDFKSTHKCENNQNEEEDMSSDILSILEQKKQNLQKKKSGLLNRLIKEKEQYRYK